VLATVADLLVDVEKLIKSLITLARVIHVDETSSNINGARWWMHVASTPMLTAYALHRSRGRAAVTDFDVLPGVPRNGRARRAVGLRQLRPGPPRPVSGAHQPGVGPILTRTGPSRPYGRCTVRLVTSS
jgi:hypothetical protein